MHSKYLIAVLGPTASGKTDLAASLADFLNTAVISADSRQFYREMRIGTTRPSEQQLKQVRHFFIDEYSIFEPVNASGFEKAALAVIGEQFKNQDILVLTGGSGMYVDSILNGFNPIPDVNPAVRHEIIEEYNRCGLSAMLEKLQKLDPDYFLRVDRKNPRRVLRALEICVSSGRQYSYFLNLKRPVRPFSVIKIGLELTVDELYQRIETRCDNMIREGLLKEVEALYPFRDLTPLQTIGYQEFFDFLDGKYSFEFAIDKFRQHTRNYAKKQLTWLRRDRQIHWFSPARQDEIFDFVRNELNLADKF